LPKIEADLEALRKVFLPSDFQCSQVYAGRRQHHNSAKFLPDQADLPAGGIEIM